MTQLRIGNPIYVAAERFSVIRDFIDANNVAPVDVRPITQANALRAVPHGIEIWVLGEVGSSIAQEISFLVERRGATVRYAGKFDIIERKECLM